MKLKVCGITSDEQFHQLALMDVDFAGFIFYRGSSRYVSDKIDSKQLRNNSGTIKKTGVFVNEDAGEILKTIEKYSLDVVQLHGDESPQLCKQLSQYVELIKAFRINDENENCIAALTEPYAGCCDYFLFDAAVKNSFGGTGMHFNWQALGQADINKPFFLSGGIDSTDINRLKDFNHPDVYAADINSRFEIAPGYKDMKRVAQFANAIKDQQHDNN